MSPISGTEYGDEKERIGEVTSHDDPVAIVRAIIDTSLYMTLATADAHGRPWASPVFFASADHVEFYGVSAPEAVHSQNLLVRPEVAIVIFASEVPAGSGQAVYMAARAREAKARAKLMVMPSTTGSS